MLWQAFLSVRDLGRLQEIAMILIRYGFGDVVRRLGMASALEQAGRALHWPGAEDTANLTPPVRVRRALEDLGPTFIKFGQVLATRIDLFEPAWIDEFSKLLDSAPPAPYETVKAQLIEDLGAPPEEIFAVFGTEPIAAASIAQVHRACLFDGSEVVVKVRRPGIRSTIEADLRWLEKLADLAAENAELAPFSPRELVRQLTQSLLNELDFTNECRNTERVSKRFEGYSDGDGEALAFGGHAEPAPIIVIPRIYWQWVRERVCVQEYINGIPGRDLESVDQAGLDRKVLARRGARAVLKMILEDGIYHADPHPGNVIYLRDNRIAFIDFGMMGRLSPSRREQLVSLLLGLVQDKPERVIEVLLDWTGDSRVDETSLLPEIQTFVDQYNGVPLKQLDLGNMLADLAAILRRHRIAIPVDLALLIKAFVSLEGIGRELDPEFDMASETLPMLERSIRARLSPKAVFRQSVKTAGKALSIIAGLPDDLSRLLRAVRRGHFELRIDVVHLKRVGNQLDRAANRITIGIITAALIIGSSIVMTVPGGPKLFGLPAFGLIGFIASFIAGTWLFVSIWRTRKED